MTNYSLYIDCGVNTVSMAWFQYKKLRTVVLGFFFFMAVFFFVCPLKAVPMSMTMGAHSSLCGMPRHAANTTSSPCFDFHLGAFQNIEKSLPASVFLFWVAVLILSRRIAKYMFFQTRFLCRYRRYMSRDYRGYLARLRSIISKKFFYWLNALKTSSIAFQLA